MTIAIQDSELSKVLAEAGLEPTSAARLQETFQPFFNSVMTIYEKSSKIIVTDATQLTEMKQAKEARLALRDVRLAAEKTRKQVKADALKACNSIDKVAGVVTTMADIEETRLLEQEQFAARKEAERKAAVKVVRESELRAIGIDPTFYRIDDMPDQQFASLINGIKSEQKAKADADVKAKAEAAKAELARLEEEKRIRAENDRLRLEKRQQEAAAEADRRKAIAERQAQMEHDRLEREAIEEKARREREAIESKARKERIEAEDKLRKEREAREAIEARQKAEADAAAKKLKAEADAAAKKLKAEADAKRKADRAPDREKLIAFGKSLMALPFPAMATDDGKAAEVEIKIGIERLRQIIIQQVKPL